LLRNAKTLQTSSISSELIIYQDETRVPAKQAESEVMIRENADGLTVYVPSSDDSLEACFGSSLPKQLVKWMVRNSTAQILESAVHESAIAVVTGILATKSAVAMDRILENNGFIDVYIPNLGPEFEVHTHVSRGTSKPQIDPQNRTPSSPESDAGQITPDSSATTAPSSVSVVLSDH
jgi:hypothetical protein